MMVGKRGREREVRRYEKAKQEEKGKEPRRMT